MDTFLYAFYSAAYIALLIWSLNASPKAHLRSLNSFLYLVLAGLIFDNTVVAVGKFIGEGAFLETLNQLRYWIHAMITPTLVLFSLGILRTAGLRGINNKFSFYIAVVFTSTLILLEMATEVIGLELKPSWQYGVLRYIPAEASGGPPLMIILVTLVLIISGIILWRSTNWPWMFIGALIMTLGSAVQIPVNSSAITNGFELLLAISLVATKIHQEKSENVP